MQQRIIQPCASAAAMSGGALRQLHSSAAVVTNLPFTLHTQSKDVSHILADTRTADDSGAAHEDTRQPDSGAASPEAGAAQAADWIEVGLIRSVHGLRGEVKVEPLTDSPAERLGTAGARHAAVSTTCMLRYCSRCFMAATAVLSGLSTDTSDDRCNTWQVATAARGARAAATAAAAADEGFH